MKNILISISFITFALTQYNFNLTDVNSTSPTYGQEIGPQSFLGIPTLYYFGHQYWSICSSRLESLNALLEEHFTQYFEFNIIGVGKTEYSSSNSNFTNETDLLLVVDSSAWINWNVGQKRPNFLR